MVLPCDCVTLPAMTRIQISPDLALDTAEQGNGPLILMIAGGFMDMDQWALVADALSEQTSASYRIVRYDQRGSASPTSRLRVTPSISSLRTRST